MLETFSCSGELRSCVRRFFGIGGAGQLEDCAKGDEVLGESTEEQGHERLDVRRLSVRMILLCTITGDSAARCAEVV